MDASICIYSSSGLKFEINLDKTTGTASHSLFIRHPDGEPLRQFVREEHIRQLRDECNRALTELEVDRIAVEQGKAIEGQLAAVKAGCAICGKPATCFGSYEGPPEHLCNECFGRSATLTGAKPMTAEQHNKFENGRF